MDYQYENLTPDRFQEFAQALLVVEEKGLVCFPVGQGDGGRDALRFTAVRARGEFAVYQVKFSREPAKIRNPGKWLQEAVAEELPKIKRLAERGATSYFLMTNVRGTASLDTGSIDRLTAFLTNEVPIPSMCLWRDDLNRRLDSAYDLKWTYPELLSSLDVLRALVENGLNEDRRRRANAVRTFVRAQYDLDSEVKFRQVELQNDLLDLFIDVPTVVEYDRASRRRSRWGSANYLLRQLGASPIIDTTVFADGGEYVIDVGDEAVGAAALLLHPRTVDAIPRIVLEGAPGQGKSTIAQYTAQVHRIRLLGLADDLARIPDGYRVSNRVSEFCRNEGKPVESVSALRTFQAVWPTESHQVDLSA